LILLKSFNWVSKFLIFLKIDFASGSFQIFGLELLILKSFKSFAIKE